MFLAFQQAYALHVNGVKHCVVRYRQLHTLHEQIKKDLDDG